ncbi:uncharacterized protein TM35_000111000 [Trypanosoma theileri]|uniref:Uncharacterized protein n=1 Tax=Trypanosoma theileri TaxID=67003 RepID=A0A1X0NXZ6_9TRYP|nr:uncharacterized protein TM35_000111000 [Trypanosoma theileri]ORC89566.1 hypothetical protein TM35_000111000 [Trypanosoma theileri]
MEKSHGISLIMGVPEGKCCNLRWFKNEKKKRNGHTLRRPQRQRNFPTTRVTGWRAFSRARPMGTRVSEGNCFLLGVMWILVWKFAEGNNCCNLFVSCINSERASGYDRI